MPSPTNPRSPRERTARAIALAVVATVGVFLGASATARAAGMETTEATEYEVKAAFVYNLARFVLWPELTAHDDRDLIIASPSGTLITSELEKLRGMPVGDRRVAVLAFGDELPQRCHIIVFEELATPAPACNAAALTVGQSSDFLEQGGMILLKVSGGRLAFEVDIDAVRAAGLELSSRVLQLASKVHTGGLADRERSP